MAGFLILDRNFLYAFHTELSFLTVYVILCRYRLQRHVEKLTTVCPVCMPNLLKSVKSKLVHKPLIYVEKQLLTSYSITVLKLLRLRKHWSVR